MPRKKADPDMPKRRPAEDDDEIKIPSEEDLEDLEETTELSDDGFGDDEDY